jgi:hypothetical protein
MTIQEIHAIIDEQLRKSQAGFVPPEQKDRAINWAQDEYFQKLQPAHGTSQSVVDDLQPFKKEQGFVNGSSPSGIITLNADYETLLAVETVVADDDGTHYIPVELVNEDELSYRKSSQLIPLSVYNPVGRLIAPTAAYGQFRVKLYPEQASAGTVYYLRTPARVRFAYSTSGRTITYNSGTSTQIEWNDTATRKIIDLAIERIGLTLQDITAIQFSQAKGGNQ